MVAEIQAAEAAHPDIVDAVLDRQELPGPRHLGRQGLRQRRDATRPSPRSCSTRSTTPASTCRSSRPSPSCAGSPTGYGTDTRITNIVNTREVWIVFAVNPDGAEYDLTGSPVPRVAQEPPAEPGFVRRSGPISTATTATTGPAAADRRARQRPRPTADRGAFSAPETRAIRDFMLEPAGRWPPADQDRDHVPHGRASRSCGRTATRRRTSRADMTVDDHAALAALGRKMAPTNGYTPMQSSSLYVTDGDEIDWAYGVEHIFMYTFELYPSHARSARHARFYPPDEVIAPQTERNKAAILMLIEARRLPVHAHRQVEGELRTAVRRLRDVRRLGHATRSGTDTATARRVAARQPAPRPPGRRAPSRPGSRALVTGCRGRRDRQFERRRRRRSRRSARRRSRSRRRSAR